MKKYIAEFVGTLVLVLIGCGTAMLVGCGRANVTDEISLLDSGYILTAFAFGLVIVAMAYSIGNISGCHINPAVSLGVFISGGMKAKEMFCYWISQCLGAFAGAGLLALIFEPAGIKDMTGGYGTNGLAGVNDYVGTGLLVECLLTFVFVLAILGVTAKKGNHGSFAGLVIGFTLVLVHILGIGLTGTSVNPARSLGPAIVNAFVNDAEALKVVWVFWVGPLTGAALAAILYKYLESDDKKKEA